jgi:hypothetical protein
VFTLDTAHVPAGDQVTNGEVTNSEAENGDAKQGGSAIADLENKLDVAKGDVEQTVDPGNPVKSLDAQQGGLPAADPATTTPDPTAVGAGNTQQDQAGASGGGTAAGATTPPTEQEKDGNKVVPGGPSGGKYGMSGGGGLSDSFKSVQHKINTSISKVTDRLKGDTTEGSEGTNGSGAGAGKTSK